MSKKHLIVIGGPTASGKTAMANRLARQFHTSVLSADSRQLFREMTIGTAKPSPAELRAAPHYFIDSLSVEDTYSVGQFEREATDLLKRLYEECDVVVMAGGSGLYIKAVCDGLDEFPEVPVEVRRQLEKEWKNKGLEALQEQLRKVDPEYAEIVDLQNPHRLIRALSVSKVAGKPYSSFLDQPAKPRPFTPVFILLELKRDELYARINARVDKMMEDGLLEEAKRLYPKRQLTALQTVGYQELFDHFDGKYSLEKAVSLIKRNSRRYAKRQLTWFRKDSRWKAFHPEAFDEILMYLERDWELGVGE